MQNGIGYQATRLEQNSAEQDSAEQDSAEQDSAEQDSAEQDNYEPTCAQQVDSDYGSGE